MTSLFLKLVNMSITASWMVAAVIILRFLLKKGPKSLICSLWLLVAIRLVCPFSMESALSLMPEYDPVTSETFQVELPSPSPRVENGFVAYESPTGEITYSGTVTVDHIGGPFPILLWLTGIWLCGMVLMLLYMAESCFRIRRKMAPAICIGETVWICDHIDSPFIFGLLHPRICLPLSISSPDADYVLAHERAHLKRRDHWWKPLGFLLLSIYWFNPVIWLAYVLLCRDIELACDERVVKEMDTEKKKGYSSALLHCSLSRRSVAACPLAFGEVGVKKRVKHVLYYKKPAFRVVLISSLLCIAAAVCLLTDPATEIHLYEIDDSRNYSDLFANTEELYIVKEGEEYPVVYPGHVLNLLDDITVRERPVSRSREETRDKTHRVHLKGNTWLNFSWNFTHVWIDNGVKPTYTYRVNEPDVLRDMFDILTGENLWITATDVSPTGLTAVYSPKQTYVTDDFVLDENYWLEVWDGEQWTDVEPLEPEIPRYINCGIDLSEKEKHILDWSVIHGSLPAGKYRVGRTLVFLDIYGYSGLAHDLYAEFSIPE